jgi:hypothetical protein
VPFRTTPPTRPGTVSTGRHQLAKAVRLAGEDGSGRAGRERWQRELLQQRPGRMAGHEQVSVRPGRRSHQPRLSIRFGPGRESKANEGPHPLILPASGTQKDGGPASVMQWAGSRRLLMLSDAACSRHGSHRPARAAERPAGRWQGRRPVRLVGRLAFCACGYGWRRCGSAAQSPKRSPVCTTSISKKSVTPWNASPVWISARISIRSAGGG